MNLTRKNARDEEQNKTESPQTAPLSPTVRKIQTAATSGFSFQYPADWGLITPELDDKVIFSRSRVRSNPDGTVWRDVSMKLSYLNETTIRSYIREAGASDVPKDFLTIYCTSVAEAMLKFRGTVQTRRAEFVETSFGEGTWMHFVTPTRFGYQQLTRILVAKRPDGSIFQVNLMVPAEEYIKYEETFEEILASVSFR
jgi:hypothetical protein